MAEGIVKERRLLVDFENVQKFDLSTLPEGFQVTIFVGSAQLSLPFDLVQDAQGLGSKLEWLKVEGNGHNALDFHIAYYLGCLLTQCPQIECTILSKDSGFDPLVHHLKKQGLCCRRINSLLEMEVQSKAAKSGMEVQPKAAKSGKVVKSGVASEAYYQRAMEVLTKTEKNSRPRQRKTLLKHLSSMFQKKLSAEGVAGLMERLFAEGKVVETDQTLSYTF